MKIKDELLYDFGINMPRLLISGHTAVIDNVKRVVLITDKNIIVDCKSSFTSMVGEEFEINQIEDERMLVTGVIKKIEFFTALQEIKD